MRFLVILSILISAAFGTESQQEKSVASPVHSANPSGRSCKLSTGFVSDPLMVAIWQGDLEMVKKLVTPQTNLNAFFRMKSKYSDGLILTTPLTYAIHAKNDAERCSHSDEMIEFLLEHDADPNFHGLHSMVPLQMAASSGDLSSLQILLKHGARLEDRNEGGETALMIAAQRKNGPAIIDALVSAGANIHFVNKLGDNAVMLAAWQHHLDTVKFLVGLGADACAKNNDGETAIDEAESNLNDDPGKHEIISFLREKCGS